MRLKGGLLLAASGLILILYVAAPAASACSTSSCDASDCLYATANIYGSSPSTSTGSGSYSGTTSFCGLDGFIDVWINTQYDTSHYYPGNPIDQSQSVNFPAGDTGGWVNVVTSSNACSNNEVSVDADLSGPHCVYTPTRSPGITILSELSTSISVLDGDLVHASVGFVGGFTSSIGFASSWLPFVAHL